MLTPKFRNVELRRIKTGLRSPLREKVFHSFAGLAALQLFLQMLQASFQGTFLKATVGVGRKKRREEEILLLLFG